jgi:hypothetical protein
MIDLIDKRLVNDKVELFSMLKSFLEDKFQISGNNVNRYLDGLMHRYLTNLEDDGLSYLIEFPYTDKVYRNSFYHYYASKLYSYKRDCIRVSIFRKGIDHSCFRDPTRSIQLSNSYLGFFIVRPLTPALLGRNALGKSAFSHGKNLLIMTAPISAAVNGIKLSVNAFPHSSQDSETISCAETTLWSLMEYFGNKYPEYKPILPSKIHEILSFRKPERQIPSAGLELMDISFALKKFGFGSKVYSRSEFGDHFFNLFRIYIESGIPVVTTLQGSGIGHAIICVGRKEFNPDDLMTIIPVDIPLSDPAKGSVSIYFNSRIERDFVFIDDNWGPYQTASLSTPCAHYRSSDWLSCQITSFVVPLYSKIYLEAFQVESYLLSYTQKYLCRDFRGGEKVFFRMFLASSRSFKQHLALNSALEDDAKEVLVSCTMPKFIWVAELSDMDLIKEKKGNGLIILDATEVNIVDNKPLILSVFQNVLTIWNDQIGELEDIPLHLSHFDTYTNNLGGF